MDTNKAYSILKDYWESSNKVENAIYEFGKLLNEKNINIFDKQVLKQLEKIMEQISEEFATLEKEIKETAIKKGTNE